MPEHLCHAIRHGEHAFGRRSAQLISQPQDDPSSGLAGKPGDESRADAEFLQLYKLALDGLQILSGWTSHIMELVGWTRHLRDQFLALGDIHPHACCFAVA